MKPEPFAELRESEFKKWKQSLSKCADTCDGDLVGEEHDEDCPMFGKNFATHFDAFTAGFQAAQPTQEKLAEAARRIAAKLDPYDNAVDSSWIECILTETLK